MKKKEIQQLVISFVCALLIYGGMMFAMSSGIINTYWSGILIVACINIVLATSLNLASGYLGQLTLGHAGFMSVGAYVSALCSIYMQVPFIVSLLIGALVAAVVGLIIGIPTLRLKGDYLCIITLAFNEIIRVIMLNIDITNGAKGLMGIPPSTDFTAVFLSAVVTIYVMDVPLYLFVKMKRLVNWLVFRLHIIKYWHLQSQHFLLGLLVDYMHIILQFSFLRFLITINQ